MYIDVMENMIINGVRQFFSIRSEKKDAPLLLYLHGGPGDSALPLVLKYNKALEEHFTVVILEQRGAGKSYYKFSENEKISIDTFVEDVHALTLYLLARFNQERIYLIGHSWGSVIGLKFIEHFPQLIHSYIGCGQVINMMKSSYIAYEYAMQKNIAVKNEKNINKLKHIDPTYTSASWLDDLLFVTRQVVSHKGSLYGKTNYNRFVWDFIMSSKYNFNDLFKREKGSLQSIKFLWQELMQVDFETSTRFDVPVVFIEGRWDSHVSSKLVENYFNTIKTRKKIHYFEQSCHFPQWSESDNFNSIIIALLN